MALDVIRRLKAGPVTGEKQDPALVTKAPKLTKEMGLIDWSQPAERIARLVRAMQPWPTAYTFLHRPGKEPTRVQVIRVRRLGPVEGLPGDSSAVGTLVELNPARLVVPVYDGSSVVEILDLQPAGKKRVTAAEFLRGYPVVEGMRFGPPDLHADGGGR